MSRLELLVPPPVIMLLTGLVMWMLAGLVPALGVPWGGSLAAGAVIALLGLASGLAGPIPVGRARTPADPRRPARASTLVTAGIYGYSRNPMYLGVLLILIGWAVYLGNVLSGLCALGFVAYISRFQILPEERLLQEKFGEDFLAYKSAVRRWL